MVSVSNSASVSAVGSGSVLRAPPMRAVVGGREKEGGDGGGVSECGIRDLGSGLVFWSGLSFNFIPHFMHTGQVFFFSPKGFFDMLPFKAKYNV